MISNRFVRKPFYVDAVQVTQENMEQVAEWCNGDIRQQKNKKSNFAPKYIKVRVARPMTERQTKAYVGDWVLYAGTGYKVYTDKAFKQCFDKAPKTYVENNVVVNVSSEEVEKNIKKAFEPLSAEGELNFGAKRYA